MSEKRQFLGLEMKQIPYVGWDDDKKTSWAVCLENEIIFHRRMDFAKHITRFFRETGAVSARRRLAGCTVGCAILYAGVPKVKKGMF